MALLAAVLATVLTAATLTFLATGSSPARAALPSSFAWQSGGALVSPQVQPGHNVVSVKDPTVVNVDGKWHVYATTADTQGRWSMVYFGGFSDWSQAGSAPQYHMSDNPNIGSGYRAAPQMFYFAPRDQWYLVYQTGLPSFSTLTHPSRPQSATAPRNFMSSYPPIVTDNMGPGGYVVDHWVSCDSTMCYLYFNNDNGYFFRAETTVGDFPNGFRNTVIMLNDANKNRLFEASNIYKLGDTGQYLLLVEAIGSDGRRYFRSWTSNSLRAVGSQWTPLADSESNPFARSTNVSFPSGAWTRDISHGEMLRSSNDQTLTIDPCNLRFLYQGLNPSAGGDYSQLPYRLGLLTQTNSNCTPGGSPTASPSGGPTTPVPGACSAVIRVAGDWYTGWQGNVTVTAGAGAVDGWTVRWTWPGGQTIGSAWNAAWSQSGSTVTAADVGWNGRVEANQSREVFGFTASGPSAIPQITCTAD